MKVLTDTISRILFAMPLVVFGLFHLTKAGMLAGAVPIPGGVFWVYLTGLAFLAASVAILIKKYTSLATLLLGIMLLAFVLLVQLPGTLKGGDSAMMHFPNLLKDTALAGAAFFMSGIFKKEEEEKTVSG